MLRTRQKSTIPANAADRNAETIAVPEHTTLQPADHKTFFAGIDTPSAPTEKLSTAFARYHQTVVSR